MADSRQQTEMAPHPGKSGERTWYREAWRSEGGRRHRSFVTPLEAWWHTPFTVVFLLALCALLVGLIVLQHHLWFGAGRKMWLEQLIAWLGTIFVVAKLGGALHQRLTGWFARELTHRIEQQHAITIESPSPRRLTGRLRRVNKPSSAGPSSAGPSSDAAGSPVLSARCSLRREQYRVWQQSEERFEVECDDGVHLIEAEYLRVGGLCTDRAQELRIYEDDLITVQGNVEDRGPFRSSARRVLFGTEREPVRLLMAEDVEVEAVGAEDVEVEVDEVEVDEVEDVRVEAVGAEDVEVEDEGS